MKRRIPALLFASALLLTACGGENPPADTTAPTKDTEPDSTTVTEPIRATPDGTGFSGESVHILTGVNSSESWLYKIESTTGDVLNDAIYKQNETVEETLGVDLTFEIGEDNANALVTRILNSVLSAENEFDMVLGLQWSLVKLADDGVMRDLNDSPYLDFDQPWWSGDYMKNLNIADGRNYFATGDITLSYLRWMTCTYFNKTVYESFHGDPASMYQTVLDGNWTMDKLLEMTRDVWVDLNGNNNVDTDDRLGYRLMLNAPVDSLYMNAGGNYIEIDKDGTPVLNPVSERSLAAIAKVCDVFWENPSAYTYTNPTWDLYNHDITGKFAEDNALFLFGYFYSADYLRDMESDYGIIPYPKCDTDMDDYRAYIHNDVAVAFVPITCSDEKFDAVTAVMEEMAYQGYRLTSPTYYDSVLKGKYLRDNADVASQMIDLIHDAAFTDAGVVYADLLDTLGFFHRQLINGKNDSLATLWASWENSMQEKLDDLLETLSEE